MEPLGKFIDIVLAVAVFILLPVSWGSAQYTNMNRKEAERITNEFVTNVSSRGYIDPEIYEAFVYELGNTGRIYSIEFTHESNNRLFYTSEILNKLCEQGIYPMELGDSLEVTIENEHLYTAVRPISGHSPIAD